MARGHREPTPCVEHRRLSSDPKHCLTENPLSDRPNFLILMADQLTARALPAYGNKIAKTPHIDALAEGGVVFDSFYCNSPLYAPSARTTMQPNFRRRCPPSRTTCGAPDTGPY